MIPDANSIVPLAIQIKNGIMKYVNVSVKTILRAKKIIVGILAYVFMRKISIEKVLLMIQNLCAIKLFNYGYCGITSINMANTISKDLPTNSDSKNVRYRIDCYILHTVSSVIILLLTITIICYYYTKN